MNNNHHYQNISKKANNKKDTNISFYEHMMNDLQDEALIWRISYELGGQKFYIPIKVTKNHFFCRYGEKFFEWLVKNYEGHTIVFPSGMNSIYKRNKTQAEILAKRGFSNNEIARQLGVHYRTAQRAKKKLEINN